MWLNSLGCGLSVFEVVDRPSSSTTKSYSSAPTQDFHLSLELHLTFIFVASSFLFA